MRKDIFREVALERLASPEQLDHVMQVTTPKGWVALGGLGAVLVTAVAWGFLGSIPERIHGQGILIRSGGVFEVVSESDGRVMELSVGVGDPITEGQVVARLAQPELAEQIQQAEARVAELAEQYRQLSQFGVRDAELQAAYLSRSRANVEQSIAASERALAALREKVNNEERLVTQGLITRQALLATTAEYERLREKVRASRSELAQLSVRELQLENDQQKALQESRFKLYEAKRELARLQSEQRLTSTLTSAYTGRVVEVTTERGRIVGRGEPVLMVDRTGRNARELEVVVYVPSAQGKKIRPGMEIQIVPSTVQKEEHGYLLGTVSYVSDFPTTPNGMRRVLKNQQLVTALSGTDAPFEVHARLVPDPRSPSAYRWSSSRGPQIEIQSGTLATASIVVERRRPISVMIPQLRRYDEPGSGARVGLRAP
ncbi:MAG TPA: NHLP bacteriocin system secretion protein [Longimicrobiaceae bacterium]|nr:NHLP bacteriocin system secretion protein [Longimicrobiaceae bacterium]